MTARAADRIAWGGVALGAAALVAGLVRYWGTNPGTRTDSSSWSRPGGPTAKPRPRPADPGR